MYKINEINSMIEVLEAVKETLEFSTEDIDSMGLGDWQELIERISQNGYYWNENIKEIIAKALNTKETLINDRIQEIDNKVEEIVKKQTEHNIYSK